jgi:hypothetical protein
VLLHAHQVVFALKTALGAEGPLWVTFWLILTHPRYVQFGGAGNAGPLLLAVISGVIQASARALARTRWRIMVVKLQRTGRLICPTGIPAIGSGSSAVQSHFKKYFCSGFTQIKSISLAVPPHRGAFRDRHGRGAGCGGRGRRADECASLRTAKSCGPDASTPASSLAEVIPPMTVTSKPDSPGSNCVDVDR